LRLKDYDYAQEGAYFVTICSQNRIHFFGEMVDGAMRLNAAGEIAQACWQAIPTHFPQVELDVFVVMPNHVHGIIMIVEAASNVGARHASPLQANKPKSGSISAIVGSFKFAAARRINILNGTSSVPIWQRSFYDHIVRDEHELNRLGEYIVYNPSKWDEDQYFTANS
jgi:REP element-mobilizing transposase RayT